MRKRQRLWQVLLSAALVVLLVSPPSHAQSPGDANCDGAVNGDDVSDLSAALFNGPSSGCSATDVNADGRIDSADLVALLQILRVPPTPIPQGPDITLFAVTGANGAAIPPLGQINGVPVFFRNSGFGFKLVLEGRTGSSGIVVGTTTFDPQPGDPSHRPDLQIETNTPLGDGSPSVCDGGVPALDPPDFGATQAVANALNDLACNFTTTSSKDSACTQNQFGTADFLGTGTQVQFCLQVPRTLAFAPGDTRLTARLRDLAGNLGPVRQMMLRVDPGPVPPTFTPAPTFTPFIPRPTRTPSLPFTPSPLQTPTPSRTASPTIRVSPPPSPTRTPSPTVNVAFTPPTRTRTTTPTASASPTPTATVPGPPGPVVSFFGLTQSDDTIIPPNGMTAQGVPIFARQTGTAFNLVIESKPGTNHVMVGNLAYDPDLLSFPDLQIEASRDLGNGTTAVCDSSGSNAGGVPAVDPPTFQPTSTNVATVNDLACRFVNGSGQPVGRASSEACTPNSSSASGFAFVNATSTVQFCAPITRVLEFPAGDTVLTARLQDINATPGPTAQIVVRIGVPPSPSATMPPATTTFTIARTQTPTRTPTSVIPGTVPPTAANSPATPTRTPTPPPPPASPTPPGGTIGPVVTFFGLARSDDTLWVPDTTTPDGLPVYVGVNGVGFSLVVEGKPSANGKAVGRSSYQSDLSSLPDLQVEVSRPLGNGSPDVCDSTGATAGGVPAIDPPRFDSTADVINAVNDLTCRFIDGSGHPLGRGPSEGCILFSGGDQGFVDPTSTIQFCGPIGRALAFPSGETTVTVRLLDVNGTPGATAQLVLHVGP